MVKIYIQTTHSKFTFEDDIKAREILLTKFIAEDTKLRHSPMVKSGYLDPNTNFYSEEHDILPTGLLPYVYQYFKKSKIEYELIDLREFPAVNKTFVKELMDGKVSFGKYTPRDYQTEAVLSFLRNKGGGIIKLPTGCISGDSMIDIKVNDNICKMSIKVLLSMFNNGTFDFYVKSYIKDSKTIEWNKIDFVKNSGVKDVYKIILGNGYFIKATYDHKIMTFDGWVKLGLLKVNELIMCGDEIYSPIDTIEYVGKEETYDIGCFENHNFVANGIVVHNSGKSFIAFLLTQVYSKSKMLFLFDRIDLVHQLYNDFTEKYLMDKKNISLIQGDNYKYHRDSNVILLSVQSYEKAFHIFPQIKIITADEAHQNGRTETAQKIIYSCQKASMHIGLSATPDVIENPVEQLRLYSLIGPIIYSKEIKEQIDNNTLSDTRVEIHHIEMPDDERPEIIGSYADVYEKFKISKEEIKQTIKDNNLLNSQESFNKAYKALSDEDREEVEQEAIEIITNNWIEEDPENNTVIMEEGLKILRKFVSLGDESNHYIYNKTRNQKIADIAREKNKRTLIIFSKIKHGEQLLELLPEAKLVHGEHSLAERNVAEMYLKENPHAIVLSSNIWSTGKDIPEIEVFINAGAGVSKIQQIQKMGRATRLSPSSGKEEAVVVDFDDSFSKLGAKQSNKRLSTYKSLKLKIDYIGE